jgi:Flp pilus assembly pilin Flp
MTGPYVASVGRIKTALKDGFDKINSALKDF